MGNCKDCKHWEHHSEDFYGKNLKEWHECEAVGGADYDEKIPDDGFALYADAADDTDLSSGLKTGPMFGCFKFLPK